MCDLREVMRVRRAALLQQSIVDEEPKPTVVMSVYDTSPLCVMFGTVGEAGRSVTFDVGANARFSVDQLDYAPDSNWLVERLTPQPVVGMNVQGQPAPATTYVLPHDGPLHRWYKEQRSVAS